MKRILAIFLLTVLTLSFTSCVLVDTSDIDTSIEDTEHTKKLGSCIITVPDNTAITTNTPPTDNTPQTDEDEDTNITPKDPMRGIIKNGVYKNDFLGFELEYPPMWEVMSDDSKAKSYGITVERYKNDSFEQLAKEIGVINDVYLYQLRDELLVTVSYIYPEKYKHIPGLTQSSTEEDFANGFLQMYEGDPNVAMTTETVTLSGDNYLRATYTINGQLNIVGRVQYFRKVGEYMAIIGVRIGREYTVADIEGMIR